MEGGGGGGGENDLLYIASIWVPNSYPLCNPSYKKYILQKKQYRSHDPFWGHFYTKWDPLKGP